MQTALLRRQCPGCALRPVREDVAAREDLHLDGLGAGLAGLAPDDVDDVFLARDHDLQQALEVMNALLDRAGRGVSTDHRCG